MCHLLRILQQTCGHCAIISESSCTIKCPDLHVTRRPKSDQPCPECGTVGERLVVLQKSRYSFTAIKDTDDGDEDEMDGMKALRERVAVEDKARGMDGVDVTGAGERDAYAYGEPCSPAAMYYAKAEPSKGCEENYTPTLLREGGYNGPKKKEEWLDIQPTRVEMEKDMMREDKKAGKMGGWIVVGWAENDEDKENATMVPPGNDEELREWDALEDFIVA